MRKFIVLSEAALLAGALAGGTQATPLSARGALATSSAFDQAMPDQGVTKAWYHRGYRHYGSYRGHQYGWHRHYAGRGYGHCHWRGCIY